VITNYAPGSTAPVEFIIPPKGSEQGPLQWDKFGRPNIALKITLTPNSRTAVIAKSSFAQAIARAPIIIAPPVMEPAIIMKTYTPDFVPWQ
jgi:hypothetical protein